MLLINCKESKRFGNWYIWIKGNSLLSWTWFNVEGFTHSPLNVPLQVRIVPPCPTCFGELWPAQIVTNSPWKILPRHQSCEILIILVIHCLHPDGGVKVVKMLAKSSHGDPGGCIRGLVHNLQACHFPSLLLLFAGRGGGFLPDPDQFLLVKILVKFHRGAGALVGNGLMRVSLFPKQLWHLST